MSVTRRKLITVGGASLLPLITGCTSQVVADEEGMSTPQSATIIRLTGRDTSQTLFSQKAVTTVGEIYENDSRISFSVTLSDEAADQIRDIFQSTGVDESPRKFKLVALQEEQEITRFSISLALAKKVTGSDWDGKFDMTFGKESNARTVQKGLACGAETAPVSCDSK